MTAPPMLMGMETEYASAEFTNGGTGTGRQGLNALHDAIRDANANVAGREGVGLFLGNGARFYLDSGHPEYATPECQTPYALLAALRAGDRILEMAAARASAPPARDVVVFRTNVDYVVPGATWGCHESYLYRTHPQHLPGPLIPHLITRIIYSGAGGFAVGPHGVGRFTLSPRSWFLEHTVSGQSTGSRGIFHTKDESLGGQGTHRLHIIAGESLCSDVAALLKCGTTALVVAAVDAGVPVGAGLDLWSPIRALRTIAMDTSLATRVRLANARLMTALEIQRRYLNDVERAVQDGVLPSWAPEICRLWRQALDHLSSRDGWAERALDWGIKRRLIERRLGGAEGWEWHARSCAVWHHVRRRLERCVATTDGEPDRPRSLEELLAAQDGAAGNVERLTRYLEAKGMDWDALRHFLSVQHQLYEIDWRFGQLGDQGIHRQLARAGELEPRLVGDDEVEHAVTHAPVGGRAMARGQAIRQVHAAGSARGYTADWARLTDHKGARFAELADPFGTTVEWQVRAEVDRRTPLGQIRHTLEEMWGP